MPPAITLKPLSVSARANIQVPNDPSNPPSTADIARSVSLKHEMLMLRARRKATDEDLIACVDYEKALTATTAAPLWFNAAISRALVPISDEINSFKNAMKTDLNAVKTDLKTLQDDFTRFRAETKAFQANITSSLNKTSHITALNFNIIQSTGNDARLEAVSNENGDNLPDGLPALSSRNVIRALSADEKKAWLQYYQPQRVRTRSDTENIAKLMAFVGVQNP